MTQACEAKVRAAEDGHARVVQQSPKAGCRCEVSLVVSTKMAAGGFSRTWSWRAEAAASLPTRGERVCAVFCLTRRGSSEAGEAGDEPGKELFMATVTRSQDMGGGRCCGVQ
jgi:hypothetical protein